MVKKLHRGYVFVYKHPRRFATAQLPEPPARTTASRIRNYMLRYVLPLIRLSFKA